MKQVEAPKQVAPEKAHEQAPVQNLKEEQPLPKTEKDKERLESDQEKMVMDLFDGKYIE